jgi:hypothetical protein
MSKILTLAIVTVALGLVLSLGAQGRVQAIAVSVDPDQGTFNTWDVNNFGDYHVYSSARDWDRDADVQAYRFMPETYGLTGDYGYRSGF